MKEFLTNDSCIDSAMHGGSSNGLKTKKYQAPSIEAITIAPTCMLGESKEGNLTDPTNSANTVENSTNPRPNFTGEIDTQVGDDTWKDLDKGNISTGF